MSKQCPECGSKNLHTGGITASAKGATVRRHCLDCGESWDD